MSTPQPAPSVAVTARSHGGITHGIGRPGLTLAGPTSAVWVPLAEAFALADRLVDLAEELEANGRAARDWTAEQNAAARQKRNHPT